MAVLPLPAASTLATEGSAMRAHGSPQKQCGSFFHGPKRKNVTCFENKDDRNWFSFQVSFFICASLGFHFVQNCASQFTCLKMVESFSRFQKPENNQNKYNTMSSHSHNVSTSTQRNSFEPVGKSKHPGPLFMMLISILDVLRARPPVDQFAHCESERMIWFQVRLERYTF